MTLGHCAGRVSAAFGNGEARNGARCERPARLVDGKDGWAGERGVSTGACAQKVAVLATLPRCS